MIQDYDVYTLSQKERVQFVVYVLCLGALISYVFYASFMPILFLIILYMPLEKAYCKTLAEKRKAQLLLQFKDFLYCISSSLATGRHMEEAMEEAAVSLQEIYGEQGFMVKELQDMLRRIRETADTDLAVFEDFTDRCGLEDVEDFTQVFSACRETGGNMVAAVNKAANLIGEKITIERDISTMVSQKKYEGKIITVTPVVIILALQLMSPDYLLVMYTTLAGRLLMSLALSATAVAYVMIERITAIEV